MKPAERCDSLDVTQSPKSAFWQALATEHEHHHGHLRHLAAARCHAARTGDELAFVAQGRLFPELEELVQRIVLALDPGELGDRGDAQLAKAANSTSVAFTLLLEHRIAISMDDRASWRDSVFVEHPRRSVKYEEVYLRAYDSVTEARASPCPYLPFYNSRRPHSSLAAANRDHAYFHHTKLPATA
jgi:hypothetical protein